MRSRYILLFFLLFGIELVGKQEITPTVIDGVHINADTVEYFLKYGKELHTLLFGTMISGETESIRIGVYPYGGQMHSIYTFTLAEEMLCEKYINSSDFAIGLAWGKLRELLEQIKTDVLERSCRFFEYLRRHQSLFVKIQEQQQNRTENDFRTRLFSKVLCGTEASLFQEHITSFANLYTVCTQILTFVHDTIEQFPHARAQFIERIAKWQKIKELFIDVQFDLALESEFDEMAFFRHVKEHNLDLLLLGEITREQIIVMLREFMGTVQND